MNINEKIKRLREQNNISQLSMAEYLKVHQSYISKIESSERNLNIELLNKIANLFVCNLYDLIDDKKDVRPMIMPYRKSAYSVSDLENISNANKIILNLNEMIKLSED